MASAAIFVALIALAYRPARVAPAAIFVALVAGGMSRRWTTLAGIAVGVAAFCWLAGMAIAVVTSNPLW